MPAAFPRTLQRKRSTLTRVDVQEELLLAAPAIAGCIMVFLLIGLQLVAAKVSARFLSVRLKAILKNDTRHGWAMQAAGALLVFGVLLVLVGMSVPAPAWLIGAVLGALAAAAAYVLARPDGAVFSGRLFVAAVLIEAAICAPLAVLLLSSAVASAAIGGTTSFGPTFVIPHKELNSRR